MKNFSLVCSNQRIFKEKKENFESFVRIEQYRKTGIFSLTGLNHFIVKKKDGGTLSVKGEREKEAVKILVKNN